MALRPSQIPHCFIEEEAGGRRAQLPDSHVLPYHAQDRSQDVGGPGVAACGSALRLGPADHRGAGRLAGQQGPEGEGDPCAARPGRESARPCVFPQQGPSPADDGHFIDKGDHLELVSDHVFGSASAAAQAPLGRSSNGLREWQTGDGMPLRDL